MCKIGKPNPYNKKLVTIGDITQNVSEIRMPRKSNPCNKKLIMIRGIRQNMSKTHESK